MGIPRARAAVAVLAGCLLASACGGGKVIAGAGTPAASPSTDVTQTAAPGQTPTSTASPAAADLLSCSGSQGGLAPGVPGSTSAAAGTFTVTVGAASETSIGYLLGATIRITQEGTTVLAEPVTNPAVNQSTFPGRQGWESLAPLCIAVPPSGLPTVYITGYAGAMTCCGVERAYYPTASETYASTDWDLGRGGATVESVSGTVVSVATNVDFDGKFSGGALTTAPVQILELRGGTFADVTRSYPDRIAADAQALQARYQGSPAYGFEILPAWAADECELGLQSSAFATLETYAIGTPQPSPYTSGGDYASQVEAFLRKEGYCS